MGLKYNLMIDQRTAIQVMHKSTFSNSWMITIEDSAEYDSMIIHCAEGYAFFCSKALFFCIMARQHKTSLQQIDSSMKSG